jgi:hypothetical protein
MITISLTDFVDFVVASGASKLTKVRQIKSRQEYLRRFDHWRELREGIVAFHADGTLDKSYFDSLLNTLVDEKKRTSYAPLVKNYKTFLGRKSITAENSERAIWTYKDLEVRVNPELRLTINDKPCCLIKLYFKAAALSKAKVDVLLLLIKHAQPQAKNTLSYGLLDVQRNKLYDTDKPNESLLPLLYGEADSFITIWKLLPEVTADEET